MKAAGAIPIGSMVVLGTDGCVVAIDDGTGIFGIALTAAAADGDFFTCATQGVFTLDLASGFDPDIGDRVFVATSTTVDVGDAGDYSVGTVVGKTDPASGTTAEVLIHCREAHDSWVYA
ncbi:MAG: hypothetical protein AMJ65_16445 [Phycisphaerae bacterium SG8_4]|nr:MAG: hypothetical protein AMJ65_16445 [Phycisphaerae bacterium SG8_4]